MDEQIDALRRINTWLDRLEENTRQILATFDPGELSPAQAATVASKFITIMARLLETRQQFTNQANGDFEALLKFVTAGTLDPATLPKEP